MEENLEAQWRKRINDSPEAKQAKVNIDFHKKKMRSLQEELHSAEIWEVELHNRLRKIEEQVQPPLMKLRSQLDSRTHEDGSEDDLIIEKCVSENGLDEIKLVLNNKVNSCEELTRLELLRVVKVVISIRNYCAEKDDQEGIDAMQKFAGTILKHLGRYTIDWVDMSKWEVKVVQSLIQEVVGVPPFLARMTNQLLNKLIDDK